MYGIDVNKNIAYLDAAVRCFEVGEHHITRTSECDVLVMVYEGVLRFSEDGVEYEVHPGQYHIQKANTYQTGEKAGDAPKYLYVHFLAAWSEGMGVLSKRGEFNYQLLKPQMEELARMARGNFTKIERTAKFLELLSLLYSRKRGTSIADDIADFICENYKDGVSLDMLSARFNFSKNHIINIFKREFGMTPFEYINSLRVKEAERLLEVTSYSLENIAYECGFGDYSQLYKVFRRVTGESPKSRRKND